MQSHFPGQMMMMVLYSLPIWGVFAYGLYLWWTRSTERPQAARLVLTGILLLILGKLGPPLFWYVLMQLGAMNEMHKLLWVVNVGLSLPNALGLLCLILAAFDKSISSGRYRYDDLGDEDH